MKEEIKDAQNDFLEILKEFDQQGGALCEYIAYHYHPDYSCDICPCKTDNNDKCILVTSQNLIGKYGGEE